MADKKLSALSVVTAIAVGDLFPFVSTPGGTPADKLITGENLFKGNYKIGTFTREMDAAGGDVPLTGFGFPPSCIEFVGGVTASFIQLLYGVAQGAVQFCMCNYSGVTPGMLAINSINCIFLSEGAGKNQAAILKTWDSDGVTLTFTRTGATAAGTATILYRARR